MQAWLVVALVLVNGYCLGADCVERFVNYQTWPAIDAASFRAYHQAQSPLIRWFVVVPLGLSTLLQIVLLVFNKQARIDGRLVFAMLASSLVGALSTAFLQLPIHRKLNRDGYSEALLQRLLLTDWIRKLADIVRFLATAVLLRNLIRL